MYYIKKIFLTILLNIKNFLSVKKEKAAVKQIKESANTKFKFNEAASLKIETKTNELRTQVEKISKNIISRNSYDIEKTLEYLKTKNVRVVRFASATKILSKIREKQGFILPLYGFQAFYLNFFIGLIYDKKLVFKQSSDPIFIFNSDDKMDIFFLSAQIYKFVAFRKNMPGFDYNVQKKFKRIYGSPKMSEIQKLTAGEILSMKEAIARDVESVDFAMSLQNELQLRKNLKTSK